MGGRRMNRNRTHQGFSLIELMLSIAILAILSALASPMLGNNTALQLDVAKRLLLSDLEYAQILAISYPEEEVVVVIDASGDGWHIASIENLTIPLEDTVTGEPLITTFGVGSATAVQNVYATSNAPFNIIAFDQNGGLKDFLQAVEVSLRSGETTSLVVISPTTGSIR